MLKSFEAALRNGGGLWLGAWLATTALTPVVFVSAAAAQTQAQQRSFDIPAQSLTDALTAFGRQSGMQVSVGSTVVQGLDSPGVRGAYAPEEALRLLLAGTGVTSRVTGNTAMLERAPQTGGAVINLGPVRVEGAARAADTEGTGSYTTPATNTATRLQLSLRETPQSVTVVTRQRLDDQGIVAPRDLLLNIPGITSTATAPYRESFYARGFQIENYTFDGLTISSNSSRRGAFLSDMAMFDRVEVVRGSTGLLQGAGTPSAAVNFVRKRATQEFKGELQAEAGSWNSYAVQADAGGPLNGSGTIRARGVARFNDADSYMDVAGERRQLYYLMGEADPMENLTVSLGASHQVNGNTTGYGGITTARDGTPLQLPRSTFLGNKWTRWDDTTTSFFGDVTYRFADDWTAKIAFNRIWGDQHQVRNSISYSAAQGYYQSIGNAMLDSRRDSYEASVQGAFDLFGRTHEVAFGGNYRVAKESQATAGYYSIVGATNMDIFNWNHDFPEPTNWVIDYYQRSKETQGGGFGTARFSIIDPLKLIVGGRVDTFETVSFQSIRNPGAAAFNPETSSGHKYSGHFTKYAGLVYDVTDNYSLYVSYSDIFKTQNFRDVNNEMLEPVVGENYEAGVKAAWFDDALNATVSVYQLNQANLGMSVGACPFNPLQTCYAPTGLARSKGYDLEIQGAITPQWQVSAGYTHVITRVVRDVNPARVGLKLNTMLPANLFKLATSYRQDRWRIGGNLRWQSKIYYNGTTPAPAIPYHTEQLGYVIVDAMAGYAVTDNVDLQLNVSNLFDQVYYSAINAQVIEFGGNTVYGAPRSIRLTAKYNF